MPLICKKYKQTHNRLITTNFTLIIITVIQVIAALQYFDVNMTQTNTQIVQLFYVCYTTEGMLVCSKTM